jgi:hypothetical protein
MMRNFLPALAIALGLSTSALAGPMEPTHGYSVDLGQIRGSAYYTVEPDGLRLVAIFAEGENGKPIRLNVTLSPNQRLRVAVPGEMHGPTSEIEFVREGDEVVVWRPIVAMN